MSQTNSNSKVKIGESVAVIALKRQDKKYPKANTKKTVIACLLGRIYFSIYLKI